MNHPQGGLARRASYLNAFQAKFPQSPYLYLDGGQIFSDIGFESVQRQLQRDALVRNEWVLRGYQQKQPNSVINLTEKDLPYYSQFADSEADFQQEASKMPLIRSLISANIAPLKKNYVAPPPYLIKDLHGPRLRSPHGDGVWRVGIIGVTSPEAAAKKLAQLAGYDIGDPAAAIRRVAPEVRRQADVVILLAAMPADQVVLLAQQLSGSIDIVVGHPGTNVSVAPNTTIRPAIVMTSYQTRQLGEMRLYADNAGHLGRINNLETVLDDKINDDPDAAQIVANAHHAFVEAQVAAANAATPTQISKPLDGKFVGSNQCISCHQQAAQVWQQSGHSRAIFSLIKRGQQFDQSCIGCHVVGFQQGGFVSYNETPALANVQCESCHGSGREHLADTSRPYGKMAMPAGCVVCHTKVNSPEFNLASYWPKIAHGKH